MSEKETDEQLSISRRGALECMIWAGTGILWTLVGRRAEVAEPARRRAGGRGERLHLPADQRQPCRLQQAGQSRRARHPAGGDRQGRQAAGEAGLHDPHRRHHASVEGRGVRQCRQGDRQRRPRRPLRPGEHDYIDEGRGKAYLDRYGKGTKGAGWYSFDDHGVHFIGLVNVVDLKAGGLGRLGADQLAWLADDLKGKAASTPIVVFAHIPLWTVYADWGWGTDDGMQALQLLKRFGSVTVLNGHIHQIVQKVEGNMVFHTARSTAFPQPAPGKAQGARTDGGAGRPAALACSAFRASRCAPVTASSPSPMPRSPEPIPVSTPRKHENSI